LIALRCLADKDLIAESLPDSPITKKRINEKEGENFFFFS